MRRVHRGGYAAAPIRRESVGWPAFSWSDPALRNLTGASNRLRSGVKDACAALLQSTSPSRVMQALSAYRVFIRFLSSGPDRNEVDEIDVCDLLRFGESLSKRQRYQLRRLKEQLILWAGTGAYGLTGDLQQMLPKIATETHEVGAAVRTMDPDTGPLTDLEYDGVVAAMRRGFATGEFELADYTLMVLALTLAARPLQLAAIKVKDFTESKRQDGTAFFILQVTRLKQGKGIRPRTLFRPRELASGIGELVRSQCNAAKAWAIDNGIAPEESPLFPSLDTKRRSVQLSEIGLEGHFSGKDLGAKLSRLLNKLRVTSHRTGRPLDLFQTRLRRTFGTRAAAEGLSAPVIADLMDHSWVDSSLIYIETRPEMMERIDKAMALKIAPIAQAFAGTMIRQDDVAISKVIHFASQDALERVGGCGKFAYCGLAAPLACYTCSYFNPWTDAPHVVLLDQLLAEREELMRMTDLRHASVNDRTILAVADVVARCRAATEGRD
jgi:integrase